MQHGIRGIDQWNFNCMWEIWKSRYFCYCSGNNENFYFWNFIFVICKFYILYFIPVFVTTFNQFVWQIWWNESTHQCKILVMIIIWEIFVHFRPLHMLIILIRAFFTFLCFFIHYLGTCLFSAVLTFRLLSFYTCWLCQTSLVAVC